MSQDDSLLVLDGKSRDLGEGLSVRRILPQAVRRSVGPFVFYDHIGPVDFAPGHALEVRPHPHIGLETITYCFEGEILHRDSLGVVQPIQPGAVNWMTAGRGIVHSECVTEAVQAAGQRLHAVQAWVALPLAEEECEPAFHHHRADQLPVHKADGVTLKLLAGSIGALKSPVPTKTPTLYADLTFEAGACFTAEATLAEERALYIADGAIYLNGQRFSVGQMPILTPGRDYQILAEDASRVMLLGGAPLDAPRTMFWNFVSSRKERIEQAKNDWQNDRFPKVLGDDARIPLPD
jgi:redox-sensitive bicupin YhaK (pirin superfamily)